MKIKGYDIERTKLCQSFEATLKFHDIHDIQDNHWDGQDGQVARQDTRFFFISIIRLKSVENKHNLSITKAQILPQDELKNGEN